MSPAGTILCGVPASCFSKKPSDDLAVELLRSYMPQLRTIERRLGKCVAVDDESTRYARICRQIEDVALGRAIPAARAADVGAALAQGHFPSIRIGGGYLDLLARSHAAGTALGPRHEARLGASVYAPDELLRHVKWCRTLAAHPEWKDDLDIRHRLWFIERRLAPRGCGLIETTDAFGSSGPESDDPNTAIDVRTWWERLVAWIRDRRGVAVAASPPRGAYRSTAWVPTTSTDWQRYGSAARGELMKERLREQVQDALTGGPPIDLGNQRHALLTDVLGRQIHKTGEKPASVAMIYESGQPTRTFPLRCVDPLPDGWTPTRELHVGLVSMRHLPIDQYVDINWYRNVDVPSHQGLSGADEACYQVSIAQFAQLANVYAGHRLRIYVYHSGFLPAVVAFYRALVTRLSSAEHTRGSMQVMPMLQPHRGGAYKKGNPWPG